MNKIMQERIYELESRVRELESALLEIATLPMPTIGELRAMARKALGSTTAKPGVK